MRFLFGGVSSSSWCLGWAALFHCGTPLAFHIIISRKYTLRRPICLSMIMSPPRVHLHCPNTFQYRFMRDGVQFIYLQHYISDYQAFGLTGFRTIRLLHITCGGHRRANTKLNRLGEAILISIYIIIMFSIGNFRINLNIIF